VSFLLHLCVILYLLVGLLCGCIRLKTPETLHANVTKIIKKCDLSSVQLPLYGIHIDAKVLISKTRIVNYSDYQSVCAANPEDRFAEGPMFLTWDDIMV